MSNYKKYSRLIDALLQLQRNGVWGTCADCPKDELGNTITEKCKNFHRYDHKLEERALFKMPEQEKGQQSG